MGRGGRLDAHRARVYLISRLACEVAGSRRDLQAWAILAHGASLAERRVVPSLNEKIIYLVRTERVNVENKGLVPSLKRVSNLSSTPTISERGE